jgi:tetratricopeptide (TPR) repeat protein
LKWRRKLGGLSVATGLLATSVGLFEAQARLPEWVRHIEASSPLRDAFFRLVAMPGGAVRAERPPQETRVALSELIRAQPEQADLYSLRAHEAERQLDFSAAEEDWKEYASRVADPVEGQLALADFYHRRLRPEDEVEALLAVGRSPAGEDERLRPASQQRSWAAFERSLEVIEAHALPAELAIAQYRAWRARYAGQPALAQLQFDFLIEHRRLDDAQRLLDEYQQQFPDDAVFSLRARAEIARQRGSADAALALYDESFDPLWPPALIQEYFSLLEQAKRLRSHLDRARARVAGDPDDLQAAGWVFHYYQRQGNLAAAQAALADFRQSKEARQAAWTTAQLRTLAQLYRGLNNHNETARHYYALYSLTGADAAEREQALAGLIELLLGAPDQPIALGSGNLSFYRDIATMDDHPGLLNGILSLLLNGQAPQSRFGWQEASSVAYFHRAKAAELLALFGQEFPQSERRAGLRTELLQAFATYGDNEGVLRSGQEFLKEFPESYSRTQVALLMAEAYARTNQTEQEFAAYDALLEALAQRAEGVPIGESAGGPPLPYGNFRPNRGGNFQGPARSPEYARVLDLYIARLLALERLPDALALYAREIQRNPDDPGLYERLAAFLEQNGLSQQVEAVYQRAIGRFQASAWHDKLARWYLRQQRAQEFARLSGQVIQSFSGTDLEGYFRNVVDGAPLSPQLYLQLNLYAQQRFPHNLTFVRNLLRAYQAPQTRNLAAWESLLRQHWYFDADLRSTFFEFLSRTGRLQAELAAIEASTAAAGEQRWHQLARENSAAAEYIAEARVWRSHFEEAAPVLLALATDLPAEPGLSERATSIHRSLAHVEPNYSDVAASLAQSLHLTTPRDRASLALIGDIWADRELFERAAPAWERMPEVEPGRPEGYLEAATVYWDYYLFDDALRMIDEGRNRLSNPALYAYEAGAIHENRRDYTRAVSEYLKGALAPEGGSAAERRLIELSRRPAHRELVDQVTAQLVAGQNPGAEAVGLRVAVLEAQLRRDDLAAFLSELVETTTSFELLEQISNIASSRRLDAVRVQGLERQIALTQDPVDRMRLRLSLMQLHESGNEVAAARQVIEELYRENPKILGVVRARVDFAWRHNDHGRALVVLDEAAGQAYPELSRNLRFEAARKATEVAQYGRARQGLETLLADDPFEARYLAAMADTYGRENDYAALREFYEGKIAALGEADLPATRKKEQLAALRRGLIPALTKLGEHAAAVEQYIEILNRFPDDEALAGEAAWYAESHGRRQQLIDYYVKTTAESPKDYRYHRVLGWVYRDLEQLSEAIEAFGRASAVRPEMAGLLESRAALEARLMRFDAALATYQQLYELRYHDPHWMEQIAEVYARQQRRADAVEAIEKALISGRPERAENFVAAAERLADWNYLEDAERFAERAIEVAGDRLLQDYRYDAALRLYARLATRLRGYEAAYRRLLTAWPGQPNDFTDERLGAALGEMAAVVATDFTPEEKGSFVAFLEKEKAAIPPVEFERRLLPVAQQAGLTELEARWLHERMMADPGSNSANTQRDRLVELQQQRLRHEELTRQLETYWQVHPPSADRDNVLLQAAEAYRAAGDSDAELRVLDLAMRGSYSDRLLELLLEKQPGRLTALATPVAPQHEPDRPANMALAGNDADLALRVVEARGRNLPPVWTRAYSGLVGLYFGRQSPQIRGAFEAALGTATIGERLGAPTDPEQQLAGDLWFYYGSRFGEYLSQSDAAAAEAYLPAMVEAAPGRSSAYAELGDSYHDRGDLARAAAEYEHALELNPNQGRLHDGLAEILWTRGEREQATDRWRAAIEAFGRQVAQGITPPSFWGEAAAAIRHIGGHGLEPQLRETVRAFFAQYTRRNGSYRIEGLLGAWYEAAADKTVVVEAALALGEGAPNPEEFLGNVANAAWLPLAEREAFLNRLITVSERRLAEAMGPRNYYAERSLDEWRIRRIEYWLETAQAAKAQAAIDSAASSLKQMLRSERAALWVEVAVRAGRLDALLESYRQGAAQTPPLEALRDAATALRRSGESAPAQQLLEFYYTRRIEQRDLSASNFLGLAELRLEQARAEEGMALLRRMTMVAGEPFEHLEAAAELLRRFGRHGDAAGFLTDRLRGAPWDLDALLHWSQAQLAAAADSLAARAGLVLVASSPAVAYEKRAEAARTLAGGAAPGELGSAELALLAAGSTPAPGSTLAPGSTPAPRAGQPFYFEALLDAARAAAAPADRTRLLREAVAIDPQHAATRLDLFRAAQEAAEFHLAVAAFEPLAANTNLAYRFQQYDSPLDEQQPDMDVDRWMAQQFLSAQGFNDETRAALAGDLAHALEQVGRLSLAELLDRLAVELAAPGLQRAAIEQSLERVRSARRLRAENARRRPVITKNLEQDRLVRPRLAAAPQTGGAR